MAEGWRYDRLEEKRRGMSCKKTVLVVVNKWPSRSETFIERHVEEIMSRGAAVVVFSAMGKNQSRKGIYNEEVHCAGVPQNAILRFVGTTWILAKGMLRGDLRVLDVLNLRKLPVAARSLSSAFVFSWATSRRRKMEFDVCHVHFGSCFDYYKILEESGAVASRNVVVSFHGVDIHYIPRRFGFGVYAPLFKTVAAVTANSEFSRKAVIRLGCPDEKCHVIPAYVSFAGMPEPAKKSRGPTLRILAVGRLVEKKGFSILLRAIAHLRAKGITLSCRIAGDGPLRRSLCRESRRLNLTDSVTLVGWADRAHLSQLMQWTDLVVAPSVTARNGDMEGQGVILQEAQYCGIPVIASAHNGFPESILDGQSGFLAAEASVEDLCAAIMRMLNCRERWDFMGRSGHEYVLRKYDSQLITRAILELYDNLDGSPLCTRS